MLFEIAIARAIDGLLLILEVTKTTRSSGPQVPGAPTLSQSPTFLFPLCSHSLLRCVHRGPLLRDPSFPRSPPGSRRSRTATVGASNLSCRRTQQSDGSGLAAPRRAPRRLGPNCLKAYLIFCEELSLCRAQVHSWTCSHSALSTTRKFPRPTARRERASPVAVQKAKEHHYSSTKLARNWQPRMPRSRDDAGDQRWRQIAARGECSLHVDDQSKPVRPLHMKLGEQYFGFHRSRGTQHVVQPLDELHCRNVRVLAQTA